MSVTGWTCDECSYDNEDEDRHRPMCGMCNEGINPNLPPGTITITQYKKKPAKANNANAKAAAASVKKVDSRNLVEKNGRGRNLRSSTCTEKKDYRERDIDDEEVADDDDDDDEEGGEEREDVVMKVCQIQY